MRRELAYLVVIAAVAFGVRVYAPWRAVFAADRINFLETDAWYHVRLIENQVRNWPWRVTLDPYAAPGGQFVPIAPLFDTMTATAAVILHGRDAETRSIERVAAFVPPVLGTLTVIVVWALGRSAFDARAGLLGAALLAIVPGHFLDRSLLGFYDHHVLEALLALTLLWVLSARHLRPPPSPFSDLRPPLPPPSPLSDLRPLLATSVPAEAPPSPPKGDGGRLAGAGVASGDGGRVGTEVGEGGRRWWKGDGGVLAGVVLGLYLLGWGSGAFLIGILGVWLVMLVSLTRSAEVLTRIARVFSVGACIALLLVVVFHDHRMHRYLTQVLGLAGLGAMSVALGLLAGRGAMLQRARAYAGILLAGGLTIAIVWLWVPGLLPQVLFDLRRLTPDSTRMAVLEARPLFMYSGAWDWLQPWEFFRTGFYAGAVALVLFSIQVWRERRPIDSLLWVFTLATFAATIGQNRFGYYLMPACAVLGGWLAARILDWGGVPHSFAQSPNHPVTQSRNHPDTQSPNHARTQSLNSIPQSPNAIAQSRRHPTQSPNHPITQSRNIPFRRELALIAVSAGMFAPNLVPAALATSRSGSLPSYWHEAMIWLRNNTPPPFRNAAGQPVRPGSGQGDEYYLARYPRDNVPVPEYTVMNWWDQGYWITQIARRVPVSNPTQDRAPNAARFYAATSEAEAAAILAAERVGYVLVDWELPYRMLPDRTIMGRFQNVVEWAKAEHAKYYEVYYRNVHDVWTPVWVFHEPYYQSMAYRLMVLGGARARPANATSVLVLADRTDQSGLRFREIVSSVTYATYEEATEAARREANVVIAGFDPWRSAFPLERLTFLRQVHESRTPEQKAGEAPWVRIFGLAADAPR